MTNEGVSLVCFEPLLEQLARLVLVPELFAVAQFPKTHRKTTILRSGEQSGETKKRIKKDGGKSERRSWLLWACALTSVDVSVGVTRE